MTSKRARGFGWARRLGNTLLGVGVTTLLLALAYVGLTSDLGPQDGDLPSHLNAVPVERGILRELVIANGSLEPSARVVVQSEIPGIVAYVHVDNGDRVEPGQPLVELDRERLEDRVAELAAALAERRARARVDLVGRAELELRKARRDLERVEGLHAQGIASRETLELEEYRAALAEIGLGDAHAEKAARRASVREAENALRRMRRDVEKSIIRSPIGGVVVRRHVEVGTAVADLQNGGTVVVTLADDRRLHVLAEVDENDVAAVRVGQRVEVRIDAFPDEPLDRCLSRRTIGWSGAQSVVGGAGRGKRRELRSGDRVGSRPARARRDVGRYQDPGRKPRGCTARAQQRDRSRRRRAASASRHGGGR
ncbi:MAG: efflux RND transporter periplasmic adaptor subunit [Deltaproteobacteria bacterium]|nr:efflux RND transporter periplasmic adaptor subunit [Deltaproteobacteria bacterium]